MTTKLDLVTMEEIAATGGGVESQQCEGEDDIRSIIYIPGDNIALMRTMNIVRHWIPNHEPKNNQTSCSNICKWGLFHD